MSALFADHPVDGRAIVAAERGFAYVESWWPFQGPTGTQAQMDRWCRSIETAGVSLVLVNLDAGDVSSGSRGLLSDPGQQERVEQNLQAIMTVLSRTGCRVVNALWGNRDPRYSFDAQYRTALANLVAIADRVATLNAVVVVEPLNSIDNPSFLITHIGVAAEIVEEARRRSRSGNVALLADTYHLAMMGMNPADVVRNHGRLIGHVQVADAPGRGRPGTGEIDFAATEQALIEINYTGFVGMEYIPTADDAQPLWRTKA